MAIGAFSASNMIQGLACTSYEQSPVEFNDDLPIMYYGARYATIIYVGLGPLNGIFCVLLHWLIWPRPPENHE